MCIIYSVAKFVDTHWRPIAEQNGSLSDGSDRSNSELESSNCVKRKRFGDEIRRLIFVRWALKRWPASRSSSERRTENLEMYQ